MPKPLARTVLAASNAPAKLDMLVMEKHAQVRFFNH